MINVMQVFLPPQEEYNRILKRAWDDKWITNRGNLVRELEDKLKLLLNVPNIIATTNGTLPLQIAIKSLGVIGEIITTSFSYVATTSSIAWEGCTPVFVDIHPEFLTIDETKIEAAITNKTSAILATHVYGNPCNVEVIEKIAKKYSLKVIYDAAHCFGVTYKGRSIFNYGDISTCSFHATKFFHTGEGGAIFAQTEKLTEDLFNHHNFGHKGKEEFFCPGINAKMSELQAAMGLSILPYLDDIFFAREKIFNRYVKAFEFENIDLLKIRPEAKLNYSYFPIVCSDEEQLLRIVESLNANDIYPRRYFYPSLNCLPYVNYVPQPVAERVSKCVLCLPIYPELADKDVERIIALIKPQL